MKLGQKGFPCKLVVKKRLNSEVYEVEYHHLLSHSTGLDNIKYTKISKYVKEFAKTLFSEGYIFDRVRHGIDESDEFKLRDQVMDDRSLKSIQRPTPAEHRFLIETEKSQKIPDNFVMETCHDCIFKVQSINPETPGIFYEVDVVLDKCSCHSFINYDSC